MSATFQLSAVQKRAEVISREHHATENVFKHTHPSQQLQKGKNNQSDTDGGIYLLIQGLKEEQSRDPRQDEIVEMLKTLQPKEEVMRMNTAQGAFPKPLCVQLSLSHLLPTRIGPRV